MNYFMWAIKCTSMTIHEAIQFANWAKELSLSPRDALLMYEADR